MIRPSSLPKLAECPCYESQEGTSPAADRGTMLDAKIRSFLATGVLETTGMDANDIAACDWAAQTVRDLAGESPIISAESELWVDIDTLAGGTMDVLLPDARLLFDIKSGQIRSYYHQMAAYALGCMDKFYVGSWDTVLVFCDQQKVVRHSFTYADAKAAVAAVVDRVNDPQKKATPCEYCDWCSKASTCSARLGLAETAVSLTSDRFEQLLANPEELGKFLTQCKHLDSFREKAEEKAKLLLGNGEQVEGWKLRKGSVRSLVFPEDLAEHRVEWKSIAMSNGAISANKAKKIWDEVHPETTFPEELIKKTEPSNPILIQSK